MTSRLKVTDLDFDTIKTNLKAFLNQQSEFTDYDFEGSGLSVLIDLLAYNTHYNAYYLNMVANEAFLDTALLRDSVVSHAKLLNYTPASRSASMATLNISIVTSDTTIDTFTIPRGTTFASELIVDQIYNFVTIQNHTVSKSNVSYLFENVEIYEGTINTVIFDLNITSNPNQIFSLPDINIDTKTLLVSVRPNKITSLYDTYILSTDVLETDSSSLVFYLQEGKNQQYEIYFGDDHISKMLSDGSEITVSYLITNGDAANKAGTGANSFVPVSTISALYPVTITTVDSATGGNEKETVDSIKFSAPKRYATQNRLVTSKDYASFIKSNYPGIQSISVWGGEEQVPIVYNKTFISLKMKGGYYLSETEKTRILNDIVRPKAILTVESEIIDPEYLYILVNGTVKYDITKTNLSQNDLLQKITNTIKNYNTTNLENFDSRYIQSKLQSSIDNSDVSFIGSVIQTKVQKRLTPSLNINQSYTIDFGVELNRGSLNNNMVSSFFNINDSQGALRTARIEEIPYSFTGIEIIEITNPGFSYKTTPTIAITGDGSGATATAKLKNGIISSITITNPGVNYTRATISVVGDGYSGSAIANLQGKKGRARLVYYNENSEAVVLNSYAGTIYYDSGILELTSLQMISAIDIDGLVRFTSYAYDNIINSSRNTLILIDPNSSDSVSIEIKSI